MNVEIKIGDRVKVEFEGVVGEIDRGQRIKIRIDTNVEPNTVLRHWVHEDCLTVIPTPYVPQVGDLVRHESGRVGEVFAVWEDDESFCINVERITGGHIWRSNSVVLLVRLGEVYLPKGDS